MKRAAFEELLLLNEHFRNRNGLKPHHRPMQHSLDAKLKLVVSNPSASKPLTEAA